MNDILRSKAEIETFRENAHLRAEVERLRREGSVAVEKVAELIGEKDSTKARMQEHLSAANALALRIMRERNDARSEVERLREALEEVCPVCFICAGSGKDDDPNIGMEGVCWHCDGTGRDYHGSEKARQLLEGK